MRHFRLKLHSWQAAGVGYAKSAEANANRLSETLWCSPHCVPVQHGPAPEMAGLFAEVANV